jgi:hypothetical protein
MLVAVLALLCGCASPQQNGQITRLTPEDLSRLTPPPNPKVPLSEVISLSAAGTPPEVLIKKLQDTGTFYNLNAQQIVDLSKQGVDQRVIDHLVDAQEKARQATLLTELADRDAKAAQALERERNRRRAMQQQYNSWNFGYGAYGGNWGPRYGLGWSYGSYYDPFFRAWRPRW